MEVTLTPELQDRLEQWKAQTGRETADLIADAVAACLDELGRTRTMLEDRYDSVRSGDVTPIDGEEALRLLRERTETK